MKEFRSKDVIKALIAEIAQKRAPATQPVKLMEVCGTHTMTIHRYGLKKLLEQSGVLMLSGPGCPVCITPNEYHEAAIDLVTERENLLLATFGDMTRVPTQKSSLQKAIPADGSQVQIVYSPEESLQMAKMNPEKQVVFFGVGFETTIPSIAVSALSARKQKLTNYSILSALWIVPPPLRAILEAKDSKIQGFLYPGHVSAIIGEEPYRFIPEEFGIPGAIAGFEPVDILLAISNILDQINTGEAQVANEYTRVVRKEGNIQAQKIIEETLELKDANWRGLGQIPASGLKLIADLADFDAENKLGLDIRDSSTDLPGCRCGDVLKGKISPPECPLYGQQCTPDSPYGPCMVSFEGACLAHYKYGSELR